MEAWTATDEVHAGAVAHGRFYAWVGTTLRSPLVSGEIWRCPLGPGGVPAAGLAPWEALAISGARAVLALRGGFVMAHLHQGDSALLAGGTPLMQAGGPHAWLGWVRPSEGEPVLWHASVAANGDLLPPVAIPLPLEAAPAPKGRLVLGADTAAWPATDGKLWALHLPSGKAASVADLGTALSLPWMEADGPRAAWELPGRLSVALSPPLDGKFSVIAGAGRPPLRSIHSLGSRVVVLGDRLLTFDGSTGEQLHETAPPTGAWVHGALVPAEDGAPRLLALTREEGHAALTVVRPLSGVQDTLWREPRLEPRMLLAVGEALYVLHREGVVVLRQGGAPAA